MFNRFHSIYRSDVPPGTMCFTSDHPASAVICFSERGFSVSFVSFYKSIHKIFISLYWVFVLLVVKIIKIELVQLSAGMYVERNSGSGRLALEVDGGMARTISESIAW